MYHNYIVHPLSRRRPLPRSTYRYAVLAPTVPLSSHLTVLLPVVGHTMLGCCGGTFQTRFILPALPATSVLAAAFVAHLAGNGYIYMSLTLTPPLPYIYITYTPRCSLRGTSRR